MQTDSGLHVRVSSLTHPAEVSPGGGLALLPQRNFCHLLPAGFRGCLPLSRAPCHGMSVFQGWDDPFRIMRTSGRGPEQQADHGARAGKGL